MAARGSAAWRSAAWGTPCQSHRLFVMEDWLPGHNLYIDKRCEEAFRALARILQKHGYAVVKEQTGSYNCRYIKGTRAMSSHAWGTAVDINWHTNPFRRDKLVTDMPRAMVSEILSLRTNSGAPVWRWGGDWDGRPDTGHPNYDAMHFEIIATPEELATGIVTEEKKPNPQPILPVLRRGDRGDQVAVVQRILGVQGPSIFGPKTEAAVKQFQTVHGLTADGIVGARTWAALVRHEREKHGK